MFLNFLCIGLGGFTGACLRAMTGIMIAKAGILASFPLATLLVNITGSFMIGFLLSIPFVTENPNLKGFLTAGLLGGLTTFSTFSFDTLSMIEHRMIVQAFANIILNVVLSLIACFAGYLLAKLLIRI